MEAMNTGLRHPVTMTSQIQKEICFAVFDGISGEDFGEEAAFTAAQGISEEMALLADYCIPERQFLKNLCAHLNSQVCRRGREMHAEHMGTTMAALLFSQEYVYLCNLGDSKAFRLRDGVFQQISETHYAPSTPGIKGQLTQFIGMDESIHVPEPYIAKGELRKADKYLICSNGLTATVTNLEITRILMESDDPSKCVRDLVDTAQSSGSADDVTVIAIRIGKNPAQI